MWFEDARVKELVVASISCFFADRWAGLDDFLAQAMATQQDRYTQVKPIYIRDSGCRGFCHEGLCLSDLVCHTTSIQCAASIVQGGRILSACRANGVTGEQMAKDPRNAAGDPPDYFDYIMFGPGNCTAVDKLVLERAIGYPPSWEEFEDAFRPGVRFFFRADDLRAHPGFTLDGIHEKIHEELALDPWLVLAVIPADLAESDKLIELARLKLPPDRVASFSFNGMHHMDWARMVYCEAKARNAQSITEN
jgi:hypothetical protein